MFCTPMFPPGTYISPRSRQKVLQQSVSHLHRHPTPLYATFHPNTGLGVYVGHSQSLCVSLSTTIRAQKMRRPHRSGPYLGGCVSTVCSNPFGSGSFVCPKCRHKPLRHCPPYLCVAKEPAPFFPRLLLLLQGLSMDGYVELQLRPHIRQGNNHVWRSVTLLQLHLQVSYKIRI